MPRQRGPLRLSGTLEDITFYKTIYGSLARSKSSLTKKRVLTDPAFENSRGASREFANASKASAAVRKALGYYGRKCKDHSTHHRMNSLMGDVVKSDKVHMHGARTASAGNLKLIKGFSWNTAYSFGSIFRVHYSTTLDMNAGTMKAKVSAFEPRVDTTAPAGATHCKVKLIGAGVDLEAWKHETQYTETEYLPMEGAVDAFELNLQVQGGRPLVLAMGVQFFKLVSGVYEEMFENCCQEIVGVDNSAI